MKTKRHSRMIALLLVLCLCITMLPGTVIAQEAEAPAEAKRELTMEDVLAGIADLSDLENPEPRLHWCPSCPLCPQAHRP
jgi:hypothetical protein